MPKPYPDTADSDVENETLRLRIETLPKLDGSGKQCGDGNPEVDRAIAILTGAAHRIEAECGGIALNRRHRMIIASRLWRLLVPRRRPGRKRKPMLTSAVEDYKAGMRGPQLYRKYIPGLDRMNRYKREVLARRLRDAIRTRIRREQRQQAKDGIGTDASLRSMLNVSMPTRSD